MILYHVQTKERDEPRPRAGVLRTREFTMKDSYSFDRDAEGLDRSYELHIQAYDRIFDRCGIRTVPGRGRRRHDGRLGCPRVPGAVRSGGERGGGGARLRGERRGCLRQPQPVELPPPLDEPREVPTPGLTTVEEVSSALGVAAGAALKAIPVVVENRGFVLDAGPRRSPPQRDQAAERPRIRLSPRSPRGDRVRAGPARVHRPRGRAGSGAQGRCDPGRGLLRGSQQAGHSPDRRRPGARLPFEELDIRSVEAGDTAPGGRPIEIEPAIEVGQIFKLGTRYSEPLGANYLDEQGSEHPIVMGSYGIGPARTVAAAIEQGADERGIVWPRSIAPWDVHLVGLGKGGDEVERGGRAAPRGARRRRPRGRLRRPLRRPGGEAHGRRAARVPAADHGRSQDARRGSRSRHRRVAAVPRSACRSPTRPPGRSSCSMASTEDRARAGGPVHKAPLRPRPLRPQAEGDAAGQPLRPLTLPNLVGYVRLAAIPVFLYLALSSDDGRTAAASLLFLAISLARLPGRIPRPGHGPVQPHGRPARPGRRPRSRSWPGSPSPGNSSCCPAGRWRCWPSAR